MNPQWWRMIEELAASADDGRNSGSGFRGIGDCLAGIYSVTNFKTESAIERDLLIELLPRCEKWGYEIIPQYIVDPFRYDFALKNKASGQVVTLIECDGAKFHCSPDQIERDRLKDQLAKDAGLRMFRFSGREICEDAAACAEKVLFRTHPA
jgi:very-short-patch-repair endonuclease